MPVDQHLLPHFGLFVSRELVHVGFEHALPPFDVIESIGIEMGISIPSGIGSGVGDGLNVGVANGDCDGVSVGVSVGVGGADTR